MYSLKPDVPDVHFSPWPPLTLILLYSNCDKKIWHCVWQVSDSVSVGTSWGSTVCDSLVTATWRLAFPSSITSITSSGLVTNRSVQPWVKNRHVQTFICAVKKTNKHLCKHSPINCLLQMNTSICTSLLHKDIFHTKMTKMLYGWNKGDISC